jgi:hypothetical protein
MRVFHHSINAAMLMQTNGWGKMRERLFLEAFYTASLAVTSQHEIVSPPFAYSVERVRVG